ncbi:MAG TPA: serine hydrolase [Acidimicrobiales bacterium]
MLVGLVTLLAACADSRAAAPPPVSGSTSTASSPAGNATTTTTTSPIDSATLTGRLQSVVDGFTAGQTVPFSVVIDDISTGAHVSHLADRSVLSASLYKLFVARELIRRIDGGQIDGNAAAGDGMHRTVSQCVEAMIVVSDNLCGEAGLRIVGGDDLDARLHSDGYVSTSLADPQRTSAADVALFFERARSGTLLGPGGQAGTAQLYALLKAQQVNDRLPKGLPPGTPIAHKTGDRLHWAHDAGVMSTPRGDVVIVVLSGPWNAPCCDADHPGAAEATAFGAIAELGREVYAAVS